MKLRKQGEYQLISYLILLNLQQIVDAPTHFSQSDTLSGQEIEIQK